ncbi:hypothetical protein OC846_001553 [Tilletia horrida]|uniref:Uncharacterized protein n=1 Tax=Tilletia horrida TaxID=155126 RepID=A0AAN6GTW3_9BASI|nr:hypothetical protein OC845_000653 [Tilletia horrida]KAK0555887.1 hypothetical protein OC846_001553 [Tilletia horrida]KAK0568890.1 hypothetical protein OC861_001497 [Tilletia horrida]
MIATRAIVALFVSAVAVQAAVNPEARLFGGSAATPSGPPGTAPVAGTICFDAFDCLFGGGGKGSVCSGGKCYTTTTATSTTKACTKKSCTKTATSTSTPLPSGVPAGYHATGKSCFDAGDCLVQNFSDFNQKCVQFKCYSNKN